MSPGQVAPCFKLAKKTRNPPDGNTYFLRSFDLKQRRKSVQGCADRRRAPAHDRGVSQAQEGAAQVLQTILTMKHTKSLWNY